MPAPTTPPTRVSKIIHRERKAVAVLMTDKLKTINWDNKRSIEAFHSWLNGIAIMETNKEVKDEILKLRKTVKVLSNES